MVDIDDGNIKHKRYFCSTHNYDTDDKTTFLHHLRTVLHYEYGEILCSICGKINNIPKNKPIAAFYFHPVDGSRAFYPHDECANPKEVTA